MMKIRLLPLVCAAAVAAGCSGTSDPSRGDAIPAVPAPPEPLHTAAAYEQAGLLAEVMEFLHRNYDDEKKAGREQLFAAALKGMMRELDPYSGYEPPAEFEVNEQARTGEHTGIGIEAVKEEGAPLLITAIVPDSPADKAGILPGERIFRIDGKAVDALPLKECMKRIRGPVGSELALELLASDGKSSRTASVRRERIIRSSAPPEAARLIGGDIGYLRITSFNSHTPEEAEKALKKLREEGMSRGLVIDLRNNPGGLVDGAAKTASLFLPDGSVLFSARHRNSAEPQIVRSSAGEYREEKLPVAILMNPFTASAAELFSGALRDHGRAKLVGMRSFGKGTLLQVLPLKNGGALRFAAGRYLTPEGHVIEGQGLRPDVPVELELPQLWKLSAQLMRDPGVVRPQREGAVRDVQLEAALKLLPGRSDAEQLQHE